VALSTRSKVLVGLAVVSAALVIFMPKDSETVEATKSTAGTGGGTRVAVVAKQHNDTKGRNLTDTLLHADRVVKDTVASALFTVQSWYVAPPAPPPAPVVVQAPPPPSAPPLPFAFMGSYKSEDGSATYFLTSGDRVYDVKIGDTVDNTYSIDGVNSGQLLLTYMPLKIQQTLAVGEE
jgi:hypothetical protein